MFLLYKHLRFAPFAPFAPLSDRETHTIDSPLFVSTLSCILRLSRPVLNFIASI